MAAVWLLLGKTRYPAKFLETFAGKSWVTEVPFDLTIDVLPDLLRDPDSHLQLMAAEGPQDVAGFEHIVGESRVIRDAVGRAKRAALRGVSILLLGERARAKRCSPTRSTKPARVETDPSYRSTAPRCRRPSWNRNSSDMSKGPSPEPIATAQERSGWPTAARAVRGSPDHCFQHLGFS